MTTTLLLYLLLFRKRKRGRARTGGEKLNITLYGDKDNFSLCKLGEKTREKNIISFVSIFVRLNSLSFWTSFTLPYLDYDIEKYPRHCEFSMLQSRLLRCVCCLLLNSYWTFNKRNIVISCYWEWHCVNMLLKLADNAELAEKKLGSLQCISIPKCDKDIRSQLRSFGAGFADWTVKTEAGLLLARAGMHEHRDLWKCECGRLFAQASVSQCKYVY